MLCGAIVAAGLTAYSIAEDAIGFATLGDIFEGFGKAEE